MIPSFADNNKAGSMASGLRRKRLELLRPLLDVFPTPVSILDIGGTTGFWMQVPDDLRRRCRITMVNLADVVISDQENMVSIKGDARNLQEFPDSCFDICFSNSVIEHVGTMQDQGCMAREVRRIAKGYFVQTPYRYFILEPHFLLPLWQFWPIPVRVAIYRRFRLGWMGREIDAYRAKAKIEQVRLLNKRELRWLFPDAKIHTEKIGLLVKSLIAVRRPTPA